MVFPHEMMKWNLCKCFFLSQILKQRVYYKYSVKYKYKKFLFKFDETVWFLELCNRLQLVCFSHELLIFRQQQKDFNWDDDSESWIQGLRNMMTVRITWASCHLATLVTREVVPQTQTFIQQQKSHEEIFFKNQNPPRKIYASDA